MKLNTQTKKRLEKNIKRFAKTQPAVAMALSYLQEDHLVFHQTKSGEMNLCDTRGDEKKWVHDPILGPSQEMEMAFSSLALTHEEVGFVFGLGLGGFYQAAKQWLHQKKTRRLCFFEDDLSILLRLFETELGEHLLKDPKVEILFFQETKENPYPWHMLYWNYSRGPFFVTSLPAYKKYRQQEMLQFEHKLTHEMVKNHSAIQEFLEGGVPYYKNFYLNMLSLGSSHRAEGFFGKFPKVPALICGAGPSLEKQLPLIEKMKDKALIFAGGSAMNVLNHFGIRPHFGVGLDPNRAQFERLDKNGAFEVPYFYRNRLFHYAFRRIHGPKIYVAGAEAYETCRYFEEHCHLIPKQEVEEGYNVITFSMNLAYLMGCDPIIFVGMDLGFTDLKLYSGGVLKENQIDPQSFKEIKEFENQPLLKKDIYGKPLYTLWKWISEAEYFSQFAKEHPKTTFINATEGGLGFEGVENRSLKEVFKQLKEEKILEDLIFIYLEAVRIKGATKEKLINLTKDLESSLQRAYTLLEGLLEEIAKLEKVLKESKNPLDVLETGRSALLATELEEELSFEFVLKLFFMFIQRWTSPEALEIKTKKRGVSLWQRQKKQLLLSRKHFQFLQKVAQDHLKLIQFSLENAKFFEPTEVFEGDVDIKTEGNQTKGKWDGPVSIFLKERLLVQSFFKNGVKEGKNDWYFPSGQLASEQRYVKGKWDGVQLFYYPSGVLKSKLSYKNGNLHGPSFLYNPDGVCERHFIYANGQRIQETSAPLFPVENASSLV